MEKVKYFLIARIWEDAKWEIISSTTENMEEAHKWYNKAIENKLYKSLQIAQTIYG